MSKNRDIKLDIENTKRKIKNLPVENEGKKNWLGHGGGGAIIDEMLITGATKIDLDDERIRESGSSSHISHLRNFHGLQITYPNNGGICRFNYFFENDNTSKITQIQDSIENTYTEKLKNISETDRMSIVSQRVGQDTLRRSILQLYNNKCAMCIVDAI